MSDHQSELESKLFSSQKSEMSEQRGNLLFEQYKLYVESQNIVSEHRHNANTFFLTVNTGLITAVTGFISITPQANIQYGWIIFAAIAGIILCFTWKRLIESYRQLNTGKFIIIHLLETRLPAKLFDAEWNVLNRGDGTKYKPFTQVEVWIPVVFMILYALIGLIAFVIISK